MTKLKDKIITKGKGRSKLSLDLINTIYNWVCVNGLVDDYGATKKSLCDAIAISDETLRRWENGKGELNVALMDSIKNAKKIFRLNRNKAVVNSLFKRATGYTARRTKTEMKPKNGQPQISKQIVEEYDVPPDTGAAIFILTNTDPDNWQNKQNIVAKETKETKIKVDSDAEILDEIPADVLADITETLQLALQRKENKSDGNG